MAVSIEAAFVLIDKASGPLKDIEGQAKRTDKALRGMGSGGAMGDAQKSIQKTTQILDQHGNVLSEVESKTKSATNAMEKEADAVKKLGREGERTLGFFKNVRNHIDNFTRSLVRSHPAIQGFSQGIAGVLGGLKGFATALPMFSTLIITMLPQVVALTGALGGLLSSLGGAIGGGVLAGGGLLGSFAVGLGSVALVAKPAITQLQTYEKAVTSLNKAIASGKPGQIKAAQKQVDTLAKANPGVAQLARNIAGFKKEWDKATAPAKSSFFKIAGDAIGAVRKNLGFLGGEVNKNVKAVADAVHKYITPLMDALKPLIGTLGSIFRANIGGTMGGIVNVLKGVSNIFKDMAPFLSKAGDGFQKFTERFDKWTTSTKGKRMIKEMTDSFKEWMKLLWQVARILGSVMGAGMKTGTDQVKKWADSLKKVADNLAKPGGAGGVAKWFKQTMDQTMKLLPVIKKLADSIAALAKIFKPLGDATTFVLKNLPTPAITALAAALIGFKTFKGASGFAGTVGKAFGKFGEKGGSFTNPLYVEVTNGGVGGGGGSGLAGEGKGGFLSRTRGKILDTKLGGKFGNTWLGKKVLGSGAKEGEQLALDVAEGGGKSGLFSKVLGGGTTLLKGGLRGSAAALALTAVPLLTKLIPGGVGRTVNKVLNSGVGRGALSIGSDAATGAAIGSVLPGPGTAIGAGIGATFGAVKALGWNPFSAKGRAKFVADMGKTWGAIKSVGGKAWGGVKTAASDAVGFVAKKFSGIPGLVSSALKGVGGLASKALGGAKHLVSGAASGVAHGVSSAAHSVESFFGFANGGVVPYTTNVLVGEKGPEIAHLPGGTRITPNWALPTHMAATGTPIPITGAGLATMGIGGSTAFGGSMGSATDAMSGQFQSLAGSARTWMQQIQSDATWLGNQLNQILPPESKTAFDSMVTNLTNTQSSLQKLWQAVVTDTSAGVTQIMQLVSQAFKTMGVKAPTGVTAAVKGKARGGRLPGPPRGDHIPLYSSGGSLLGVADGGELIVNRHTESRVNAMLGGRTTLGSEVAGETRPHAAHWTMGGRVPGYATGGVVGDINSLASAAGFNKIAVAGLLGNAMQESSLNPNTPGGGLWQQISNFGQGTGGSVQQQWSRMLPQIMGIRGSMNSAGSPGAAATIFEQSFERAGIPALSNRIRYANAAFAGQLGAITGGMGGGGGMAPTIRGPRINGAGAITAIGQAAIDQIVRAANMAVASAAPAIGGGGGAGPSFHPRPGPVPAKVQAALAFANQLASRHPPYGHQGAGWDLGAYDCSSYVSSVMDAAGIWPKWTYNTAAGPMNAATDPGPGKYITIGTWGTSGQQAHTMMEIMGHYFESGGSDGGPHRDSGWSMSFDQYRHPRGFSLGGIVDSTSAKRSRQNLFSRINPGIGKAGYQPTQAEAMGIQANQQAISSQFARGHALGGYLPVPWFGNGGDFIAKRPTIIGVGDRPGGERVQVSPASSATAGLGSPIHIEIHKVEVHRKGDIQRIVDEELAALARSLEAQI